MFCTARANRDNRECPEARQSEPRERQRGQRDDLIRGKGAFARITADIRRLAEQDVNPVIAVTEVYDGRRR